MTVYSKFLQQLSNDYPRTAAQIQAGKAEPFSAHLICPIVIPLPRKVLDQAQDIVRAFFELRQARSFQNFVFDKLRSSPSKSGVPSVFEIASIDPRHFSALMCFDFHLIDGEKLKLIEINTNASMALVGDILYRAQGIENPYADSFRDLIWKTFISEHAAAKPNQNLKTIGIVDENPQQQKMFAEFLLYKELFERHGARCEIGDAKDVQTMNHQVCVRGPESDGHPSELLACDLVYNRHTDFYLQGTQCHGMREGYLNRLSVFSPNPHEYALLADKERLKDLTSLLQDDNTDGDLHRAFSISNQSSTLIEDTLLKTIDVGSRVGDPQKLWGERKGYFFKPKRSFGGKAAYRGASITRNVFENVILKGDYIAQEYAPPPTIKIPAADGSSETEMKWDLRFFVYKDQIQMAVGRVYQGQTTNFKNPGGGLAVIREE